MSNLRVRFILRNRHFLVLDLFIFAFSALISYAIRFEKLDLAFDAWGIIQFILISTSIKLSIFILLGVYQRYWKNAGSNELLLLAVVGTLSGIVVVTVTLMVSIASPGSQDFIPRSIPFIDAMFSTALIIASRFSLRTYQFARAKIDHRSRTTDSKVIIVGAGNTGIRVLETITNISGTQAIGFLDDDVSKIGTMVRGLKVLSRVSDLQLIIRKYEANQVIVAIPSAPSKLIRRILLDCQELGVEHRIMPGMAELLSGKTSINTLRAIAIDDLLPRRPIKLVMGDIEAQLKGRCVLITGAGGSIGSELARQIARCQPGKLLLLGHGENSLFHVGNKLKEEFPSVHFETILVDIRDTRSLDAIFRKFKPELVFHAAAHKHVPMLESNVLEAINNNIIGTCNVIDLCNRYTVDRMIAISTDKAVNPTSVMGMTKRAAELALMHAALESPTRFASVRFGNVLGSRGSVVPIFQQQIANGGPVTITSPDMKRFFMSIPEAVLLVLKAGALNQFGPLFVLNMGEQVHILDLARDLIQLSGSDPDHDIEIKITGLRPGEKLEEELFWQYERYHPVEDGAIFAMELHQEQRSFIANQIPERLQALMLSVENRDETKARTLLEQIVFMPFPHTNGATAPVVRAEVKRKHSSSPTISTPPVLGTDSAR